MINQRELDRRTNRMPGFDADPVPSSPDYVARRWMAAAGVVVALVGGATLYQAANRPATRLAQVHFGNTGASDWDAAKELAEVEGKDPTDRVTVDTIDKDLLFAEDNPPNAVVQPGEVVALNIPLTQHDQKMNSAHGHGVNITFPKPS